ncbi:MAG TPA: FAD-dependent oxidoreductase [Gemmatimonadaceae bacterium]|nr:FAD-dependent oxidoreductase [Gemmatimonadaceae bacterium]
MTSPQRADAIVIGAGIVGAACAAALAREGFRVTVLDRAYPSAGTTSVGMGHVVVMDDSPEQLALTAYAARLWHELAAALDPRSELDACGTLWVAEDDAQLDAVRAKRDVYAAAGIASEMLDSRALAEAEPNLRAGLAGALYVTGDLVVYPPGVTLRLLELARAHGARVRGGEEAVEILPNGVRCVHERYTAEIVINAAGPHAPRLTPGLPIVPRKGHLAITDRYPGFVRHQLVELGYLASAHVMTNESVAFNVQPRSTGQVLIGSSRELVEWDARLNRDILARMLQRAEAFMPALRDLSVIRTWTGFRPATPDKLPLIGRWDAVPGLWIACGHEGLGITTSLATAQLIVDQIVGRAPAIDPAPYGPSRVGAASAA